MDKRAIGLALIAVGVIGLLIIPLYAGWAWSSAWPYGMMGQWSSQPRTPATATITLDEAKTIAQQYLASTQNPNLGIKEIMEFQNNFYITYYEKDTGIGAFEMLIWKEAPPYGMMGGSYGMGGMMGGYGAVGVIMPEPGPNMMWNSKYGHMSNGIMGVSNQAPSTPAISNDKASQLAQEYLDANFNNAKVEMGTQFYGYYTFDFTVNEKMTGMLSVDAYTGQVWYHSWHGAFIQEVEYD